MRYTDGKFVDIDVEVLNKAIDKSGLDKVKLSSMLLGKNTAYISQSLIRGTFAIAELKKLCEFLGISVDSCIKKSEPPLVVPEPSKNADDTSAKLETVIVGVGTLYEEQKKLTDLISQMLVELKALNAKQNRLENALGQIVQTSLVVKENTNKISDKQGEIKSQMNIISGRTKDIVNVFQKGGNSAK